jgi:ABC-type polysaccharide/polyol phosphate transport system ATPase subunit
VSGSPDGVPAVVVDGVSKTFTIPREQVHTLKERALHPFKRSGHDRLEALRNVSFAVPHGEFFGIVGRNGSGKSTLLKCMAGIYGVDEGAIYVNGRVSTFIELGVGFNPDLAARDNVALNAIMLGLSPRDARERFERVIEFAELQEFVDLKLKNYSSGMHVRLAFSVMIQVDADILLIDEVLAVGDAAFQRKCFDVFYRLRDEGRTVVLVTHDMSLTERFAHRCLALEAGRIDIVGDPEEVARRYYRLNFERHHGQPPGPDRRPAATVEEIWIEDETGQRVDAVAHGERFTLNALVAVHEQIDDPDLHMLIETDDGLRVFAAISREGGTPEPALQAGERVCMRVSARNSLGAGRYHVGCWVHRGPDEVVTFRRRACDFTVHGVGEWSGLVVLDHSVELDRELDRAEAPR